MPSAGEEDSVTGTPKSKHVKSSVERSGGIVPAHACGGLAVMAQEARVRSPVATHLLTSLNLPVSGPGLQLDSRYSRSYVPQSNGQAVLCM